MKELVQNHKLFSLNYINNILPKQEDLVLAFKQSLKEWQQQANFNDLQYLEMEDIKACVRFAVDLIQSEEIYEEVA